MADEPSDYLAPEQRARIEIDAQLAACGWVVQDYKHAAVAAAQGVAVREVPTEAGPADYVLYVDNQAVGVIEAKKAGTTLTGVEDQTRRYQSSYPGNLPAFAPKDSFRSATNRRAPRPDSPAGSTPTPHHAASSPSTDPRRWPDGMRTGSTSTVSQRFALGFSSFRNSIRLGFGQRRQKPSGISRHR